MAVARSPVRYARSSGFSIAWQEFGSGAADLALVWGMPNHLEMPWEWPTLASFLRGLGGFGRVVHLDQRGTGLSDRVGVSQLPTLDERVADVVSVLDAADIARVTLIGESEGAPCAVRCAAEHPDRVERVILLAPALRGLIPNELRDEMLDLVEAHWGEPLMVELQFPTHVGDPRFCDWYSRMLRQAASPGDARAMLAMDQQVDETRTLARLEMPTLVLVHSEDPFVPLTEVEEYVELLPNGSLVVIPGVDRTFGSGPGDAEALGAIAAFLGQDPSTAEHPDVRRRAVLFTDIVDSTRRLAELGDAGWSNVLRVHDRTMSRLVRDHDGEFVKSTGDGVLATFERAAQAVAVAEAAHIALEESEVVLRAGVHVGNVWTQGSDVAGMDVHVAARIADRAGAGQILVSPTAAAQLDDLALSPVGSFELKGVPGEWLVSAVARG